GDGGARPAAAESIAHGGAHAGAFAPGGAATASRPPREARRGHSVPARGAEERRAHPFLLSRGHLDSGSGGGTQPNGRRERAGWHGLGALRAFVRGPAAVSQAAGGG